MHGVGWELLPKFYTERLFDIVLNPCPLVYHF